MGFKVTRRLLRLVEKRKPKGKREKIALQSDRERQFIGRWATLGGQRLEPQHKFHPTRGWLFDWAHIESKVAIEIHGGTWMRKSRHVSGIGFWSDRAKCNAALRLDWKVFELVVDDLDNELVYREIMAEIEARLLNPPERREGLAPFGTVYAGRPKPRRQKTPI